MHLEPYPLERLPRTTALELPASLPQRVLPPAAPGRPLSLADSMREYLRERGLGKG